MRIGFKLTVCLVLALMFYGCGYDYFLSYIALEKKPLPANMDIGEMKALYKGKPLTVYDDVIVAGYVSANDYSGNFFRTFVIEDNTGAVEIKAGLYDLHNTYAMGRYVAVKAKGATIGAYDGVLQIGLAPSETGGFQTDYFGYAAVMNGYVFPADEFNQVEPLVVVAEDLSEALCGRLIKIGGLEFVPDNDFVPGETVAWATAEGVQGGPMTGYRIFEDNAGGQIAVMTSGYADFAAETIPQGTISLTGILLYGKTDRGRTVFMLKMRGLNDVKGA